MLVVIFLNANQSVFTPYVCIQHARKYNKIESKPTVTYTHILPQYLMPVYYSHNVYRQMCFLHAVGFVCAFVFLNIQAKFKPTFITR